MNTTEQCADVVAALCVVEELTEHFDTGDGCFFLFGGKTDDFNLVAHTENTTLDSTCSNSTTTGDGEDVFNRHQERLIRVTLRIGDIAVNCVEKCLDRCKCGIIPLACKTCFHCFQSRTADDGSVVSGESVLIEKFANFHFNEFEKFFVVDLVAFVKEHEDVRNTNLTSKKDVLTSLRHRAVGSSNNEDCAVHLCSTGDHVFDIVGVAGAVNVCIVTLRSFILNVCGVDRDTSCFFFRSFIDFVILHRLSFALGCAVHRDCSGKSGFAVVDVTDGTNVNVRLCSFKLCFCHTRFPPILFFGFFIIYYPKYFIYKY